MVSGFSAVFHDATLYLESKVLRRVSKVLGNLMHRHEPSRKPLLFAMKRCIVVSIFSKPLFSEAAAVTA